MPQDDIGLDKQKIGHKIVVTFLYISFKHVFIEKYENHFSIMHSYLDACYIVTDLSIIPHNYLTNDL